jgi:hypothetical protein
MLRWGFPTLAKLKGLRGGPLDLFGKTAERRTERKLLADYEAGLDRLLAGLTAERLPLATKIASVPDAIRGFGHVKEGRWSRRRPTRRSCGRSGATEPPPPRGEGGPKDRVGGSLRHRDG